MFSEDGETTGKVPRTSSDARRKWGEEPREYPGSLPVIQLPRQGWMCPRCGKGWNGGGWGGTDGPAEPVTELDLQAAGLGPNQ